LSAQRQFAPPNEALNCISATDPNFLVRNNRKRLALRCHRSKLGFHPWKPNPTPRTSIFCVLLLDPLLPTDYEKESVGYITRFIIRKRWPDDLFVLTVIWRRHRAKAFAMSNSMDVVVVRDLLQTKEAT
jgi:hypothetical protein